jgi:riboflavin synthase
MFTGIIVEQALVKKVSRGPTSLTLSVEFENDKFMNLEDGESVALDGVCLTAKNVELNMDLSVIAEFDVSHETLAKTKFSLVREGAYLNAEPALRVGDSMGGHYVSGHVEGIGKIVSLVTKGEYLDSVVECSGSWAQDIHQAVFEKGSITIDGVSLTINRVENYTSGFRVHLTMIPETLKKTKWLSYKLGETVNVESDMFAKTVANILKNMLSQKQAVEISKSQETQLDS